MIYFRIFLILLFFTSFKIEFVFALEEVDTVEITRSGFSLNRQTNTFDALLTLQNKGIYPLAPPVRVVIDSVSPKSVSLYNGYGTDPDGKPYVNVPLPNYMFLPNAKVTVPVRFINMGNAVTSVSFIVQANELRTENSREIELDALFDIDNGGGNVGRDFFVNADGVQVGRTDSEGKAKIRVANDVSEISVGMAPNYIGTRHLDLDEKIQKITIQVSDSGELSAGGYIRIDNVAHMMLPRKVPQVVIRFYVNEKQIVPDLIEMIEIRDPAGWQPKNITNIFSKKSDGALVASSNSFFSSFSHLDGKKIIFAQILDKNGNPHFSQVEFYVSRYSVVGKLKAPPSELSLDLAGIPITVSVLNTDIIFETESSRDGSFPLPNIPGGVILIKAHANKNNIPYFLNGVVVIDGDKRIEATLRGPADILAKFPAVTSTPL